MRSRLVIRIDDVVPAFPWRKFEGLSSTLMELDVRPLLGVVPDSCDSTLDFEKPRVDFWNHLRMLRDVGWEIAQHGYQHVYDSRGRDVLGGSRPSEFSGHAYQEQLRRLARGKEVLMHEGLWSGVFMAPGHSFDVSTLKALKTLEFTAVTDGWGMYPYELEGVCLVPQLLARPHGVSWGVSTCCIHVGPATGRELANLRAVLRSGNYDFLSFSRASQFQRAREPLGAVARLATRAGIETFRRFVS